MPQGFLFLDTEATAGQLKVPPAFPLCWESLLRLVRKYGIWNRLPGTLSDHSHVGRPKGASTPAIPTPIRFPYPPLRLESSSASRRASIDGLPISLPASLFHSRSIPRCPVHSRAVHCDGRVPSTESKTVVYCGIIQGTIHEPRRA